MNTSATKTTKKTTTKKARNSKSRVAQIKEAREAAAEAAQLEATTSKLDVAVSELVAAVPEVAAAEAAPEAAVVAPEAAVAASEVAAAPEPAAASEVAAAAPEAAASAGKTPCAFTVRRRAAEADPVLFIVKRLPAIETQTQKLLDLMARFRHELIAADGASEEYAQIAEAYARLQYTIKSMQFIRANLTPHVGLDAIDNSKKRNVSKVMQTGSKVIIRDKFRDKYAGVLEPEELAEPMVIVRVSKGQVVCNTAEGARVIIPRREIKPAA